VDYPDGYVQPLILHALGSFLQVPYDLVDSIEQSAATSRRFLQIRAYESIDFEHAMQHPNTSLVSAYVIRKALIRKHYLSNTVSSWLVKHPGSVLASSFKPSVHFELDYAEFLDEALVDAWDLNESMSRNEDSTSDVPREWWILKPGMSDGGNGIRLFSSMEELQAIFEEWEGTSEDEEDEEDGEADGDAQELPASASKTGSTDATMTSQLRHFIAQPYIDPPLLLKAHDQRKFHIRTYVLASGALKVFVYREMLALFAAKSYQSPGSSSADSELDLGQHLTNTCFQDEHTRSSSVQPFWSLAEDGLPSDWQARVFSQICETTGEIFEAAAREQMVHFQAIPNAFEVFGVDFLVDANLNVWLLELNAFPDFKQTGRDLQSSIVGGLFDEVIKVAVGPFFGNNQHQGGTERMPLVRDIDLGRR